MVRALLVWLHIFLLVVRATETPITDESDEQKTLYPHVLGFKNVAFNCYMNALFSSLYAIPFFHENVFEIVQRLQEPLPAKEKHSLLALGDIFVKLRTGTRHIDISRTMFTAVKHQMFWRVGSYECILEFWGRFVDTLSEANKKSFSRVFEITQRSNHLRKSDGALLKSIVTSESFILVPLSSDGSDLRLSSLIENNFQDLEAEDYVIEPKDQSEYPNILDEPILEKVHIPSITKISFDNTPNVLIFGVKRNVWDRRTESLAYNDSAVHFDETIRINDESYSLLSLVVFDPEKEHYYASISDILTGKKFIYNDILVYDQSMDDTVDSRNVCMAFYVKNSAWLEKRIIFTRNSESNSDIPDALKEAPKVLKQPKNAISKKRKSNLMIESYRRKKGKKGRRPLRTHKKLSIDDDYCENSSESEAADIGSIRKPDSLSSSHTNSDDECDTGEVDFCFATENWGIIEETDEKDTPVDVEVLYDIFSNEKMNSIDDQSSSLEIRPLAEIPMVNTVIEAAFTAPTSQEDRKWTPTKDAFAIKAKIMDPSYQLGTENFTFNSNGGSYALQLVLMSFISNSLFVRTLAVMVNVNEDNRSLGHEVYLVLMQMLLGCKSISLVSLLKVMKRLMPLVILDEEIGNEIFKVSNCLAILSTHLPRNLFPPPFIKSIAYKQLDDDEPVSIKRHNIISIVPRNIISPKMDSFEGVLFDQNYNGARLRTVFTTQGLLFPIQINRHISSEQFDDSRIQSRSSDHVFIGGIANSDSGLHAMFYNAFNLKSYFKLSREDGGSVHVASDKDHHIQLENEIRKVTLTNSVYVFPFRKSKCTLSQSQLRSANIPIHLKKSILGKVFSDSFESPSQSDS